MTQQIIGLLNPLLAITWALAFVILWLFQKERKYILLIAFSYLAFSCGIFISNVGISAQSVLHVLGTHVSYSAAMITMVWGVSRRINAPPRGLLNLAILIGATPLILWLYLNSDLINMRVIAANGAYSVVLLIGAHNLWYSRKNTKLEYWLFVLFVLLAIQGLVRPVTFFWLEGAVLNADYRESIYYSTLNLSMSILSLLLALTLVIICIYDYWREMKSEAAISDASNAISNRKCQLDKLQQVMATNIHRNHDLTIKKLAEETGIQTHQLRRMINKELGYRNFRDFVNLHRVKEAQVMLSDPKFSTASITEIAFDCGFNSIPSFNRVFKAEVGETPSDYRE